MSYLKIIHYAAIFFPFAALLFTIPFILSQYHKYGAISFYKSIIIYLFIFYLICAYFLVILPLPKISEVAQMTSPRMQLLPFAFIIDFFRHSSFNITNVHTFIPAMKESYFYVPLFNIFLTIPFGIFLRYYLKYDIKKTIVCTFLLSLFFELTQLSGLYFIYPRSYRLFDVDDLLLNTCGGIIGYMLAWPTIHILPPIDKINIKAKAKGKIISGPRRTVAFFLDFFIFSAIKFLMTFFLGHRLYIQWSIVIFYYLIIPVFLHTSTPAQKFLNIQIIDNNGQINMQKLLLRKLTGFGIYVLLPYSIFFYISHCSTNIWNNSIITGLLFLIYMITFIKYVFTNHAMFYEKISQTRLISTIQ